MARIFRDRKINKEIQKVSLREGADISRFYAPLRGYIHTFLNGKMHGLLIIGDAGLGKSFMVLQELNAAGLKLWDDYAVINGYSTPLAFYRILFQNRNQIIVLDDADTILNNKMIVGMLKNILWSNTTERVVSYNTSARTYLPARFVFKGKVIIILNQLPKKNKNLEALYSRMLVYKNFFSYEEKMQILEEIASLPYGNLSHEERMKVLEHVKKVTSPATKNLNIRSLLKAFELYSFNKDSWKPLVEKIFLEV